MAFTPPPLESLEDDAPSGFRPPALEDIDKPAPSRGFVPPPLPNAFPPREPLRLGTNLRGPSTTEGPPPIQIRAPFDAGIAEVASEIPANIAFAAKNPRKTAHALFGAAAIPGTAAYNAAADVISKIDPRGEQYSGNLDQTIPQLVAKFEGEPYRSPAQQFVAEAAPYARKTAVAANLGMVAPEMASQVFLNPAGIPGRLLALGFSADMVASSGPMFEEYAKEYYTPEDQQDKGKMAELESQIIQTGLFAPLAAKHGAKDIPITRGDRVRLAVREVAKRLGESDLEPAPQVPPLPIRQLGVRATAEPFLQPGVPELASAAMREQMSPIVTRGTGTALSDLRNAIEGEASRIVSERRSVKPDVAGGKVSFAAPAEAGAIPSARQAAVKPVAEKPVEAPKPAPVVPAQKSVELGPNIESARRVSDMTPDEFVSNAGSFNKVNIEFGLKATPADLAELKQMRDKAVADWTDAMQRAAKGDKAAETDVSNLMSKPQFFNEAIELGQMMADNPTLRFDGVNNLSGKRMLMFSDTSVKPEMSFMIDAKHKAPEILAKMQEKRKEFEQPSEAELKSGDEILSADEYVAKHGPAPLEGSRNAQWQNEFGSVVRGAVENKRPVNASLVSETVFDEPIPALQGKTFLEHNGYVRDGDRYVYKPSEPAPVKPAEAPVAEPAATEAPTKRDPSSIPKEEWDLIVENMIDSEDAFTSARQTGVRDYDASDAIQVFMDEAQKQNLPVGEFWKSYKKTADIRPKHAKIIQELLAEAGFIESKATKAAAAAEAIRKLKSGIDPSKGDLGTFNVLPKVWDAAIEIAAKVIEKGGEVADAIEAAIKHIRANQKGEWFEREARRELELALSAPAKSKQSPPAAPAETAKPAQKTGGAETLMVEGDKLKMRRSAERAQTSKIVPEPVQERINQAPESMYKRQPEAMVEEAVSKMPDAELAAVPKDSNVYVAARLELMKRLFDAGKFEEGYSFFKEVSKTGTEFGQNINQFKRLKGATPFHVVKLVNEGLKESGRDVLTKKQSEELGKIANDSINAGKELEAAKERWEGRPSEEFARAADAALERADKADLELQKRINRYQVKTWPQMLKTFAQGNPLTPASHLANTTGNVVGALMENASRTTASFNDAVFSMLARKPRTVTVQPLKGLVEAGGGFLEGLSKVPGVLSKGAPESIKGESRANLRPLVAMRNLFAKNPDIPTVGGKVPMSERARLAVEATFGIAPETMLRLLSAADKPAYHSALSRLIQEQVKLNKLPPERARMAQKFPELVFDPKTLKQIRGEAADAIFQRPSKSVQAMNALIREKGGDWGDLAFTLAVAPYRLTPWNLVRRTIQYNPLYGVAATALNAAKGDRRAAMLSSGRTVVGALLYGAGYWLYNNGLVGPSLDEQGDSPKERLLSGEIIPPGHVNLSGMERLLSEYAKAKSEGREADRSVANFRKGDDTMDLKRLGGAGGAIIQSATDIMREFEKNPDQSGAEMVGELLQNSTLNQASFTINQSFLQGVTGILEAIQRRDATRYISGVESMLLNVGTPNTLTALSRATRESQVDVKDNEFSGVIQNRFGILGADDYLTVKRDLWGDPLRQTPEGRNALLYHLFDISKGKQVTDDPKAHELYRLWRKTANKSVIPSIPERSITINKQTYPLNNEQYGAYVEMVGRNRKTVVDRLVRNEQYLNTPDDVKIRLLNKAYDVGLEFGKIEFMMGNIGELEAKPERAGFKFPEPPK